MRRRGVAVEGGRQVSWPPPVGLRAAASPRPRRGVDPQRSSSAPQGVLEPDRRTRLSARPRLRSSAHAVGRPEVQVQEPEPGRGDHGRRDGRRRGGARARPAAFASRGGSVRAGRRLRRAAPRPPRRTDPRPPPCSQARCRQVAEHHLGIGPRLRGVIGPPHHPQVVAAARLSGPWAWAPAGSERVFLVGVFWTC